MTEQQYKTEIGSEIEVTVYFDYEPEQKQTMDCPGYPSEVILNSVYVNGDEEKDILECLSDDWLAILQDRCEEDLIDKARDEYERSQEEL